MMRLQRRWFFIILPAALAVVMLLSSCNSGPPKVKIGLNTELTGSIPVVGQSCKNAAEMAVKEVNDAGGLEVGGVKYLVELSVEDNEDKSDSAVAVAQKLSSERMLAMVGPNASRNAIPASETAEANRMPMISPWSTNQKLTVDARSGKPKKYVFRAAFTDDFQGVVAAKFAFDELKTLKPAVLYDVSSEYNKGIAEVYKKTMVSEGVKIVASETYTSGDKDFSAQLTKIIKAGADTIFLPNYYNEVPQQMKQARQLGFKGKFLGSDSWGNEELVKLGGKVSEGAYFTTHYAADIATPKARAFIKGYKDAYGSTPDDVAALTYDSFGLLFQAIKAGGKLERASVRSAMAAITSYDGVTGTMQFKGTGDPIKSAVVICIKKGKFTYFKSAKP